MLNTMFAPLRKYADFSGRSNRSEYWLFVLFQVLVFCLLALLGLEDSVLVTFAWLALLVPNVAVGVRRLHDIGLSGWFYLLSLIPIAGGLFMFVCSLIKGEKGENQYGAQPE